MTQCLFSRAERRPFFITKKRDLEKKRLKGHDINATGSRLLFAGVFHLLMIEQKQL